MQLLWQNNVYKFWIRTWREILWIHQKKSKGEQENSVLTWPEYNANGTWKKSVTCERYICRYLCKINYLLYLSHYVSRELDHPKRGREKHLKKGRIYTGSLCIKILRLYCTCWNIIHVWKASHLLHIRGKSLLKLWVTTFLPDWPPPLIFVRLTSKSHEY